jgi:hypothetical protein
MSISFIFVSVLIVFAHLKLHAKKWCFDVIILKFCEISSFHGGEYDVQSDHPWWWRQYAPLKRRSTIILHGSTSQKTILTSFHKLRTPPVFPSGFIHIRIHIAHPLRGDLWCNDTDRGKQKNSEKNLFQCHFVHYKSHTHWPGPSLWGSGD